MKSGLTFHQQLHAETGPRFKVSSERQEKPGISFVTPGLLSTTLQPFLTSEGILGV